MAYSRFRDALELLGKTSANAVELSALRPAELEPLANAVPTLDLHRYSHISVHLPSAFEEDFEEEVLSLAGRFPDHWLLVAHPDVIRKWDLWRRLGDRICIENMDKRKPIGQSRCDLMAIFEQLPNATFCFDIGHAHQVDPTMCEAFLILEEFTGRLRELHVSEVNSESKHDQISVEAKRSFEIVARLIPENIPAILESRVSAPNEALTQDVVNRANGEIELVRNLLRLPVEVAAD